MENENIIVKITLNKINDLYYYDNLNYGDYKVFGQFDGLFLSINKANQYKDMKDIANDYLMEINNQTDSHKQIFYAYGNVSDQKLNEFLENDFIYQFITFIDIQNETNNIKNFLNNCKDIKYILLKTFDKHSYILITRSDYLSIGISCITSIANGKYWNLCYSILSIKQNINLEKIPEEVINVSLNFKIRIKSYFDSFISTLKRTINNIGLSIDENYYFGNSDFYLDMHDIKTKDFFNLFYDQNILDRKNRKLCKAIKFSHTSLSLSDFSNANDLIENSNISEREDLTNIEVGLSSAQQRNEKYITLLCEKENLLRKIYTVNKDNIYGNNEVIECINVFLKMSYLLKDINMYDKNSKYLVQVILPALYECAMQLQFEKDVSFENTYAALEEIHQSITTLLGTGINTQHSFFTVPALYYTPTRLITFYSNFVRKLRNTFCDTIVRYEFLLIPILHSIVDVKSFTPEREGYNHRFLSVHMPVDSLFDLKTSMVILTHEVGHFIPNDYLRCRRNRALCLINSLSFIIYNDLYYIGGNGNVFSNNMIKRIEKFTKNIKSNIISKINNSMSPHKYYLKKLEELIRTNIVMLIEKNKGVILDNIELNKEITYTEEEVYLNLVKQFNIFLNPNDKYSIYQMNLNMERILRECYSDIFSINLLGLKYEDYIETIKNSYRGKEEMIFPCFLLTRIAFVIEVFQWNKELSESNIVGNNKKRLEDILKVFTLNDDQKITFEDQTIFLPGFHNCNVYKEFKRYFVNCNNILNDLLKAKGKYEWIKELYSNISSNKDGICGLMSYINNFNNTIDLSDNMKVVYSALDKIGEDDLNKLVK